MTYDELNNVGKLTRSETPLIPSRMAPPIINPDPITIKAMPIPKILRKINIPLKILEL